MASTRSVAGRMARFAMPDLAVDDLDGFLALRETVPCAALRGLADACLMETDPHRQRASPEELARRRAGRLSAEQDALLERWGYPYVMGEWRFHMTLTNRLAGADLIRMRQQAEQRFAGALSARREVSAISVCTQEDGENFVVAERVPLTGGR